MKKRSDFSLFLSGMFVSMVIYLTGIIAGLVLSVFADEYAAKNKEE